jgi:hypothetical protein
LSNTPSGVINACFKIMIFLKIYIIIPMCLEITKVFFLDILPLGKLFFKITFIANILGTKTTNILGFFRKKFV